jgi:MarR family transcriptional regulator, organic hydroperoxide resistance regulator
MGVTTSRVRRAQVVAELVRQVRAFVAGSSLFSAQVADKLGIHPTDLQFFNVLDLYGPLTPGELARLSGLTTGGVTVVVNRLEKGGYVRREASARDRRSVTISLVPGRRRKVVSNYDPIEERFKQLLGGFSQSDLKTVLAFFEKSNRSRGGQRFFT